MRNMPDRVSDTPIYPPSWFSLAHTVCGSYLELAINNLMKSTTLKQVISVNEYRQWHPVYIITLQV